MTSLVLLMSGDCLCRRAIVSETDSDLMTFAETKFLRLAEFIELTAVILELKEDEKEENERY